MNDLPVAETHSDLVVPKVQATPPPAAPRPTPKPAPALRPIRLGAQLRDARARAEEILRQHSREEGPTGTTCLACFVTYPCAAVRAAEDVIAIGERLQPGRLGSSKALLELMAELVDGSDPPARRADPSRRPAALTPH